MRKQLTKFTAASIICLTLSMGAIAGDISSGFTGENSSGDPKCGDISCGKPAQVSIKDTILSEILTSLTGILLGE